MKPHYDDETLIKKWGIPPSNFEKRSIRKGQDRVIAGFYYKYPAEVSELLWLCGAFSNEIHKLFKKQGSWIINKIQYYHKYGKSQYGDLKNSFVANETVKFQNYHEYINSLDWKKKSEQAKKQAKYRCQICNRHKDEVILHTHHRTYERLGKELPSDLTVLCEDCHKIFEKESTNRPAKVKQKPKSKYNKNQTIISVNDIMTFGKYNKNSILQIIEQDPEYILWMDENKVLKINPEIISLAVQSSSNKSRPRKYSPVDNT